MKIADWKRDAEKVWKEEYRSKEKVCVVYVIYGFLNADTSQPFRNEDSTWNNDPDSVLNLFLRDFVTEDLAASTSGSFTIASETL